MKEAFILTQLKQSKNTFHELFSFIDEKNITYSGIVDALSAQIIDNVAYAIGWYNNEWGYSSRVTDLTKLLAKKAKF